MPGVVLSREMAELDVLRARKRSSERIAMALMRSTATALVSGLRFCNWVRMITIEEASKTEE